MKRYLPTLALVGLVLVTFGTIYTAVQQSQRSDANYPQIQLAEDMAAALDKGGAPTISDIVDLQSSLAPFTIVYDKAGKVVIGSGYLKGKVPTVPLGVLKAAKGEDYNAVTWEPAKDVRIAGVAVAAKDYYGLSGRSLREVEKNENRTLQFTVIGTLIALLLLGLAITVKALALPGQSSGPRDYAA